jgi:hypothetical protein
MMLFLPGLAAAQPVTATNKKPMIQLAPPKLQCIDSGATQTAVKVR